MSSANRCAEPFRRRRGTGSPFRLTVAGVIDPAEAGPESRGARAPRSALREGLEEPEGRFVGIAKNRDAPRARNVQRSQYNPAPSASAQIVAAARALIEQEGVESLTMRGLAGRLGVAPDSIDSHFADKSALVDAALDDVLAEIPAQSVTVGPWQDGMIALMATARETLLEHAALRPYFFSAPMRGPQVSRLAESSLALLEEGGIRGSDAVLGLRAVLTYTFGSVALDAPRRLDDPAAREAAGVAVFASRTDHRRVASLAEPLARRPAGTDFATSLRWLLDGLEQTVGESTERLDGRHAAAERRRRRIEQARGRDPRSPLR